MNDRQFAEAFAELAKVNQKRADQLVRMFKALISAGVHSSGSVNLTGLGTFSHRWWIGKGGSAIHPPSNLMRFKPGRLLRERMNKWAGCPGVSVKARKAMRQASASPDSSLSQCAGAAHGPGLSDAESAD